MVTFPPQQITLKIIGKKTWRMYQHLIGEPWKWMLFILTTCTPMVVDIDAWISPKGDHLCKASDLFWELDFFGHPDVCHVSGVWKQHCVNGFRNAQHTDVVIQRMLGKTREFVEGWTLDKATEISKCWNRDEDLAYKGIDVSIKHKLIKDKGRKK